MAVLSAAIAAFAVLGGGSAFSQDALIAQAPAQRVAGVPPAGGPARFQAAIAVGTVSGGGPSPASVFQADLTARNFGTVLRRSLSGAGLGADPSAARYRLDAHLEPVDYPSGGFIPIAVSVRSIVRYTLTELATGKVVLATTADAWVTVTRVEVIDGIQRANTAIQRSAQANAQRIIAAIKDPQVVAR